MNHQKLISTYVERARHLGPVRASVAHPCSKGSLSAVLEARKMGIIEPVLVAPLNRLKPLAVSLGISLEGIETVDTLHSHQSAQKAVELIHSGQAEIIVKGSLHTDELLAEVTKKDQGLRTERRISHVFCMVLEGRPEPLLISDAAVNIFPNLSTKKDIVQNAIDLANSLEMEPKVAILSAVETVTERIPSTIEAAALCKMADRKQINGGLIDGPLAFDNAISIEAAEIKELNSPVAGRANVLIAPDLEAGNMLAKNMTFLMDALSAGLVLGAKVPIVLTSRADKTEARLFSIALARLGLAGSDNT